jgi:hypothetical protein
MFGEQILLHLLGDYITQNHWMSVYKVQNNIKGYFAAFLHALIYSLPFLFIGSYKAVFLIFITHFLIDKFRLAVYLIRLKNWTWTENGFPEHTPAYLATWLTIIIDNIMHIIINFHILMFC